LRRSLHRLTALALKRATAPGYLGDGGGLYLQIAAAGSRSWIFRYSLGGRRREMGLGAYPDVDLAEARNLAAEKRGLVATGIDPIAARDAVRARQRQEEGRKVLWEDAVERFIAAHEGTWRNAKHRQQWRNTLAQHAAPLNGMVVADIATPEIEKVLDPIWHDLPETASRVRGRIERILDWCKVRGLRSGDNPARWRGHLAQLYPAKGKVRAVRHHEAVPIDKLPSVYARLCESEGMAALAVRFVILTAVRPNEGARAGWTEIERKAALWTVPASRMKAHKPHTVPLSREALAILDELAELRTGKLIFPGRVTGRPLSLTGLTKALRAAGAGSATVHGCRSTFKDWCSERTNVANEISEMALAHSIGDKVEAAYRRGELLQKRAVLMAVWAKFLRTPSAPAKVVPIGRKRA
jgi:integrase